jgi:hypothetical protein
MRVRLPPQAPNEKATVVSFPLPCRFLPIAQGLNNKRGIPNKKTKKENPSIGTVLPESFFPVV